jgi:hypothetical protein
MVTEKEKGTRRKNEGDKSAAPAYQGVKDANKDK